MLSEGLLRAVVLIGRTTSDSQFVTTDFCGTGFIVVVPSRDGGALYLVTARHVYASIRNDPFSICFNNPGGDGTAIGFQNSPQWYFHPDDSSVDVAVLPLNHTITDSGLRWLTVDLLQSEEQLRSIGIGPGSEVTTVGLFSNHLGRSRVEHLVRTGNIAMMPRDRIRSRMFGDIVAYLIEARSLGGMSGEPVFARQSLGIPTDAGTLFGWGEYRLIGLMHGHWDIPLDAPQHAPNNQSPPGQTGVNIGVAIVVPAHQILEVLNQPALLAMR